MVVIDCSSYNCEFFYLLIVIGIPFFVVLFLLGAYFCYRRYQIERHRPPANELTHQSYAPPATTVATTSPVFVHNQQYDRNGASSYIVQDDGHLYVGDKASA